MTMHDEITIDELTVRRLGFGTVRITGKSGWGWPRDRSRVQKVLRRATELGVTFFDTADAYGPEISEYLLEEYLHPYEGLLIATKGGIQRGGPRSWIHNGHPDYLKIACHNSLRRLRVERIDLYQLHAIDENIPLEDSLGALKELQEQGKIRHIGVSNFNVDELIRAQKVVKIVSVQNRYNWADRTHDSVIDYCEANQLVFIPWYPLGNGDLARSSDLQEIAKTHKATTSQVALSWLLHRSPVVLPIPGTTSVKHLEQNQRAETLQLTPEDLQALDNSSR